MRKRVFKEKLALSELFGVKCVVIVKTKMAKMTVCACLEWQCHLCHYALRFL